MFLFRQYYLGKKFCYSVTLLMIFFPRGKDQEGRARYKQENSISSKKRTQIYKDQRGEIEVPDPLTVDGSYQL